MYIIEEKKAEGGILGFTQLGAGKKIKGSQRKKMERRAEVKKEQGEEGKRGEGRQSRA